VSTAKELGKHVFEDPKKVEIELGCYSTCETLLETVCPAGHERAQSLRNKEEMRVGWKSDRVLSLLGDHAPSDTNRPPGTDWSEYQCLRRVIDFVSGMTDNYSTYIAKQLKGMGFSGMQRP
ncbi:MAG: deoxyguanosinetriphosphate triphosphohydrolase, partial [Gammaproteobacteria bacterium]